MADLLAPAPRPSGSLPPVAESLLSLAPLHLPNHRRVRYDGDDLCVSLGQLAARDQTLLGKLYATLSELLYAIANPSTSDAQKWQDVVRWALPQALDRLIDDVRELGSASHAEGSNEQIAKAIHDVRGGSLSALLGRLQLLTRLPRNEKELTTLFVLTRDHLKIMRNALVGLDDPRREADRTPKSHAMSLMLEKWHDSIVGPKWHERPIRMNVDCRYEGALTECCLESAAIDRIFYNLATNACRHAMGERIDMAVFPLPESSSECLRFVLSNEVSEADAAGLKAMERGDGADSVDRGRGVSLLALFEPEVSSTGSGFGLTVVAEFVAGAFGLRDRAHALRERYVGAILDGRTFRVWFHWPAASSAHPQKLDDFHLPEQSLSEV